MPRTSQTALATLEFADSNVEVLPRLRVPGELIGEAAEEFRRVVGIMPADWFTPGNLAGLVQYCRHVVMARRLGEAIDSAMSDGRFDDVERLSKLQAAESKSIRMWMTALRLTPQSVAPNQVSQKKLRQSESPWRGFGKRQQTQARPAEKE